MYFSELAQRGKNDGEKYLYQRESLLILELLDLQSGCVHFYFCVYKACLAIRYSVNLMLVACSTSYVAIYMCVSFSASIEQH